MESRIRKVSQAFALTSVFLPQSHYFTFRLGQEPPPAPQEDAYDGRSLAEVRSYLSHHAVHHRVHLVLLETCRQSRKSCAMAQHSTPSYTSLDKH